MRRCWALATMGQQSCLPCLLDLLLNSKKTPNWTELSKTKNESPQCPNTLVIFYYILLYIICILLLFYIICILFLLYVILYYINCHNSIRIFLLASFAWKLNYLKVHKSHLGPFKIHNNNYCYRILFSKWNTKTIHHNTIWSKTQLALWCRSIGSWKWIHPWLDQSHMNWET